MALALSDRADAVTPDSNWYNENKIKEDADR